MHTLKSIRLPGSRKAQVALIVSGIMVLGAVLMKSTALGPGSVANGPVIPRAPFRQSGADTFTVKRPSKAEKMLIRNVVMTPGQPYHVSFEVLRVSAPVHLIVDFFGERYDSADQEFHLNVDPGQVPLRVDRVLNAGPVPKEACVRVFYYDEAAITIRRLNVSTSSLPAGFFGSRLIVLGVVVILVALLLWLLRESVFRLWAGAVEGAGALRNWEPGWLAAFWLIGLIGVAILARNLAFPYPFVFGDEGIYAIMAKFAHNPTLLSGNGYAAMVLPNHLYIHLYHLVFAFGTNYPQVSKLLNVLFLCLGAGAVYGILRWFVRCNKALLAAIVVAVGPASIYTACFMPEAMYFCAVAWMAYFFVRYSEDHPILAGALAGIMLGCAVLVKPHGWLLLPALLIAILLLKVAAPEVFTWRTCALTGLAALLGTVLMYGALTLALVPDASLGLGRTYSGIVTRSVTKWHFTDFLYVIRGHLSVLLPLYGFPLLVVGMSLFRANRREAPGCIRLQALMILVVVCLSWLLCTTSQFTINAVGQSPLERPNRVHARYYFFLLPLLVAACFAAYERLDWSRTRVRRTFIAGCAVLAALAGYSIWLSRTYFMFFPDCPDAYWYAMHRNAGAIVVGVGSIGCLLIYAVRRYSVAVFGIVFGFVSLTGTYYISKQLLAGPPSAADTAMSLFREILKPEEWDAGVYVAADPMDAGVYRMMYYIPATYDTVTVQKPGPITEETIGEDRAWVIVNTPRAVAFPYAESFASGPYRLYRRDPLLISGRPTAGDADPLSRVFTGACALPALRGFGEPESWGIWSSADPSEVVLAHPVSGHVRLHLVAHSLGPGGPDRLSLKVGDVVKTVTLNGAPSDVVLDYDLKSPAGLVTLSGVKTKKPVSFGLGADSRQLAVAISTFDCTMR